MNRERDDRRAVIDLRQIEVDLAAQEAETLARAHDAGLPWGRPRELHHE